MATGVQGLRFEACINELFHVFLHNQSHIIEAIKTQLCRDNIYFTMLLRNIDFNKDSPGYKMKMKHYMP